MKFLIRLLFCSLFFIANAQADIKDISRIYHGTPSLNAFEICQGGGCVEVSQLNLSQAEWQPISQIFSSKAQNASQERAQIAKAIGALESVVGVKIGTTSDRAGTFDNSNYQGQLDCNDEAINTTTYMRLLKQNGLMQHHEIEDTRTRNFFFTGWPHTTAVIHDIKTGERYAVDSWFYDNGAPAVIVPFAEWKANYEPADSPIGKSRGTAIK